MREESLQFYLNGVFEGVDAFSTKKEELVKRTVEIFHTLSKKNTSAQSAILAATYLAARELGISIEPTELRGIFGTHNYRWVELLRQKTKLF